MSTRGDNRKHTPGPWRYEEITQTIRSVPSNYWIATMDSFDGAVRKETQANALLTAAAPELLEAAKLALLMTSNPDVVPPHADSRHQVIEVLNHLRKAIAKAEGRTE